VGGIRSMGLTSPVPRASVSNNPNSPLSSRANRRASSGGKYSSMSKDETTTEEVNSEYVSYTVHMPPTPDHQPMSASQTSLAGDGRSAEKPERNFISGTIFTGGYNSVTRGHVIECSMDQAEPVVKSGLICGMKGCDEKAIHGKKSKRGLCECGFKICRDCYLDCVGSGGGRCPGCKEPYKGASDDEDEEDDEDDEPGSEAEDQALPLPSMAEFKLDKRLSLVKSFKAQQNHPPDFDHARWLFETKGTYGYGNAVWPKDGYGFGSGANGFENPPDFGERSRRPLTRKVGISAAILSPYR
jgi:1,4-beta-D-xylan synthase